MIEKPGTVDGVIWLGVNEMDIARLDSFEGEYYRSSQVFVADSHDRCLDCQTYVISDNYINLLDDQPWDAEQFRDMYLKSFIEQYVGFNSTDK